MKKHSLLMLLPFALIVTGCNGLGKGSIFNEKFMKRNFGEAITYKYEYSAPEKIELNFEEGVTPAETPEGDLFQVSKDGAKGFYSVLNNSYPIPLSLGLTNDLFINDASTPNSSKNPSVKIRVMGGTKNVDGNVVLFIFDEYGNKLYEGNDATDISFSANFVSRKEAEGNERVEFKVVLDDVEQAFAYYNVDGSFKEVLTREQYFKKNPYTQYGASLAEFGHKELRYKVVDTGTGRRCAVFNTEKEKYVASFEIPKDASYTIIGDKIVYQVAELLPDRSEKYDYSSGNKKYSVSTFSVNYSNGNVKEIKTKFVFSSALSTKYDYANGNGINKYKLFEQIQMIDKDKALSPIERDVILNENLKELADVTGTQFKSLTPFVGKYYVNETYTTIYDSKLREVGKLRGSVTEGTKRVVKDSRYGIINHKGEYIEFPVYLSINPLGVTEHYLLETDTSWKIVKVTEKEKIELIKEFSKDDVKTPQLLLKYEKFIRKSDSKAVMFDVTTGEEVSVLEAPEGSTLKYSTVAVSFSSTEIGYIEGYEKDGKYTVIVTKLKTAVDYTFKK